MKAVLSYLSDMSEPSRVKFSRPCVTRHGLALTSGSCDPWSPLDLLVFPGRKLAVRAADSEDDTGVTVSECAAPQQVGAFVSPPTFGKDPP